MQGSKKNIIDEEPNFIDIDNIDLNNITQGKNRDIWPDKPGFFDIIPIVFKYLMTKIGRAGSSDTLKRFDPMSDQIEQVTKNIYHQPPIVKQIDKNDR